MLEVKETPHSVLTNKKLNIDIKAKENQYQRAKNTPAAVVEFGLKNLSNDFSKRFKTKKKVENVNTSNHQAEAATGGVCKKGVLRNFVNVTGKHLSEILLFNKVTGLSLQLY